jgi:hypothetical protein
MIKKLTIKPFKVKPKLPDDFEATTWAKLQKAIRAVYKTEVISESKEELYRAVEDLCMHKLGKKLYENVQGECEKFINESVDNLSGQALLCASSSGSSSSSSSNSVAFLSLVDVMWQGHCSHMGTLRNIFLYLDRSYALETAGVLPLWDAALAMLRCRLLQRKEVLSTLVAGLLSSIESHRVGESFQEDAVKRVLRMLLSLGQYHTQFETPFLSDTERFFTQEGQLMVSSTDPADFLVHIEKRLSEAVDTCNRYLDISTKTALLQKIEIVLLKPHVAAIAEKGLPTLLAENRIADLRRMYLLLDRVGSTHIIKDLWKQFLVSSGLRIVSDEAAGADKTTIEDLLTLHSNADEVLKHAFSNHTLFKQSQRSAFEAVLNRSQSKTAETLAKYVDRRLRGEKGVSEQDADAALAQCMTLFTKLDSKDVFLGFYAKAFSKRLLYARSASTELERGMISRMNAECGAHFTAKLEGMLHDMDLSTEIEAAFRAAMGMVARFGGSSSSSSSSSGGGKLTSPGGSAANSAAGRGGAGVQSRKGGERDFDEDGGGNDNDANGGGGGDMELEFGEQHDSTDVTPAAAGVAEPGLARASSSGSASGAARKIDFGVQVCTVGHWPLSPTDKDKLVLPAELRTLRDQFEDFYLKKHQGRKIEWCHSVERCIVSAFFPKCKKELEMSMYQTTCLMLFNVKAPAGSSPPSSLAPIRLSFKHIQKHTQLSADELRRTLQSLACGLIGTRVLTKEPKGKDVADTDTFTVNQEFTNKMFRIKFNSIQLKETFTEVEKTYEEVFRERQYVVDAVIVRIMKSRKRISHTALTGEVLQQLRFAAKPADLKLRIEAMIEREYLERDSDDPSTYNYLA